MPRGTETVLLVEDADAVRSAVRMMLERLGYSVLEAPSGAAALDAAGGGGPIDLLLTDVVMPRMSGRKLVEEFLTVRPGTKILYMSGYTDDAVVRHGVLDPGTPFMQKPFTVDVLAHKVRQAIDGAAGPGRSGA